MRVLMLGWEFPPFITGGLGTACYGLTKALDRHGVEILFALPKSIDDSTSSHVRLVSPDKPSATPVPPTTKSTETRTAERTTTTPGEPTKHTDTERIEFEHVEFYRVPAFLPNPYDASERARLEARAEKETLEQMVERIEPGAPKTSRETMQEVVEKFAPAPPGVDMRADYGGDLIGEVHRYARFCVGTLHHERFDVIHAHDWLTFPAGLALAQITGRPLVVHVHSTEFDRSGEHVNQRIYDIERRGMHGALRVICVSQLTKNVCINRYGVPEKKVEVVYNGVDLEPGMVGMTGIRRRDKIVLYFGRITYQKGPEYFIRAAKRVLEVMDNVKFVVAGSGDQATRMIEMAAQLGIGHKMLFTGFLRGADIARVFAMADMYVMPSVSEPFGIAPLEAMSHNVPTLISKSSGVSEVLTHALKCDFWDIDDMANKIVAVLRHPPLSRTLKHHGQFEVRRLTWDGAATRCEQVYRQVLEQTRTVAMQR